MSSNYELEWAPTPTYLYRNYLYKNIVSQLPRDYYFLDIGSGNGEFVKVLSKLGFRGETIDASKVAVARAKKKFNDLEDIKIKWGNIFTYKPKQKYDVIFCFEVLEHIENDGLAIKKIYRMLKPNGQLIMSVPAHMSEWTDIDNVKGHYRRYERNELVGKLKQAGFKTNYIFTYGFPILYILRRISRSGQFIKSLRRDRDKDSRSRESSITQDYNPKFEKVATNPLILYPLFKFLDLFIKTDKGFGYIVIAQK